MIVILIVDDCENDRMLVQQALERSTQSFRIFEASDISMAMAYLKGTQGFSNRSAYPPPDLIVCDFHLTRENGLSLIEKISEQPALKHVSVALMSGSFSPEMRYLAHEKGACACIDKGDLVHDSAPFLSAIEKCLSHVLASC